jgi:hypothetical protein
MDKSVEYSTQVAPGIVDRLGSLVAGRRDEALAFIEAEITKAYNRGAIDTTRAESPPAEEKS